MSLVDLKAQARAALHGAMAVPASYSYDGDTFPTAEQLDAGLKLTARWHMKMKISGERSSDDVAFLEGVNRLIFNADELAALGLTLEQNGEVTIPGYAKTLRLDQREDDDGPANVYWSVIEL